MKRRCHAPSNESVPLAESSFVCRSLASAHDSLGWRLFLSLEASAAVTGCRPWSSPPVPDAYPWTATRRRTCWLPGATRSKKVCGLNADIQTPGAVHSLALIPRPLLTAAAPSPRCSDTLTQSYIPRCCCSPSFEHLLGPFPCLYRHHFHY
jgi:hypothetical protein